MRLAGAHYWLILVAEKKPETHWVSPPFWFLEGHATTNQPSAKLKKQSKSRRAIDTKAPRKKKTLAAEPTQDRSARRAPLRWISAENTEDVLLSVIEKELQRGHNLVAIRHFLMLQALGASMSSDLHEKCRALMASLQPMRLRRIEDQVYSWSVSLNQTFMIHSL